jgi:hypothetical protein
MTTPGGPGSNGQPGPDDLRRSISQWYLPGAPLGSNEQLRPAVEEDWSRDVAVQARRLALGEAAQRSLAEQRAAAEAGDIPEKPGLPLASFLAEAPEEPECEIPGLMPKASRLVLTGEEGAGKSTVKRYMAGCHAAGRHPFTGEEYEGGVSLLLDCENPQGLVQLRLGELAERFSADQAARLAERLIADCQPGGIDLAATWWQEYVRRMVDAWKVTFVAIGPLYKLCSLPPMGEEFFITVSKFLDRLRDEHGCALAIEAHCRQPVPGQWGRDMFPYGNSGWRRWPEAGMHLSAGGMLSPWRPNRFGEEVAWPARLERVDGSQVLWEARYGRAAVAAAGSGKDKMAAIRAAVGAEPGLSKRALKAAAGDDGTAINEAVKAGAIVCQPAPGNVRRNQYFLNPEWAGGPAAGSPPQEPNWELMAAQGDPSAAEDEQTW